MRYVQCLEGHHHRLSGRRVHEVKRDEVVDPHRLELQQRRCKIRSLDLWNRRLDVRNEERKARHVSHPPQQSNFRIKKEKLTQMM